MKWKDGRLQVLLQNGARHVDVSDSQCRTMDVGYFSSIHFMDRMYIDIYINAIRGSEVVWKDFLDGSRALDESRHDMKDQHQSIKKLIEQGEEDALEVPK